MMSKRFQYKTNLTLGELETKSLHLCQKKLGLLHMFAHPKSIENTNIH